MTARIVASRQTSQPPQTEEELELAMMGPPALTPWAIDFSTGGDRLYVNDWGRLHAWNIPDLTDHSCVELPEEHQGMGYFARDRQSLLLFASGDRDEGAHHLQLRSLPDFEIQNSADISLRTWGVWHVLLNGQDEFLVQDDEHVTYVFKLPTMEFVRQMQLAHARQMIFSPDYSELWAAGGQDESGRECLRAFHVETGEITREKSFVESEFLHGLRTTPDGGL